MPPLEDTQFVDSNQNPFSPNSYLSIYLLFLLLMMCCFQFYSLITTAVSKFVQRAGFYVFDIYNRITSFFASSDDQIPVLVELSLDDLSKSDVCYPRSPIRNASIVLPIK